MRKHQQKQISQLLGQIKKTQLEGQYAACQEASLFLCDFIDDNAGEGTQTARMLVEYCELLFRAHNGENVKSLLKKRIVDIENSVNKELIATKLEMAFITYRAAQSDAIESIYFAAKEDPDCNAYWIPVPYYEYEEEEWDGKSKDRKRTRELFEGAEYYSEKFECIDYKEYDIKARKPDAAFSFALWDETSYMMEVHPDYLFKNLQNNAGVSVAVPYYLLDDYASDADKTDEELIAIMKKVHKNSGMHYRKLAVRPGYVYSDKVIMPTETANRRYKLSFKGNVKGFGKADEKYVAMGSPKIEKIVKATREDYPLPQEWLEMIGDKKVILCSHTVGDISGRGMQIIKKMTEMFEMFAERDDVVLWWRPHPLIETSLRAKDPMLAENYRQTIDAYKRLGIGIFDDTTEYHRSLAWADAYYGSYGTLPKSFPFIGRPAMLQNVKMSGRKVEGVAPPKSEDYNFNKEELMSLVGYAHNETDKIRLEDFLNFVLSEDNSPEMVEKRKEKYLAAYAVNPYDSGKKIYEYIKAEVLRRLES